jgi:hypothetical protein
MPADRSDAACTVAGVRKPAYDGGFFSDVSGVSRSNGLMTARITLVATCA